MYSLSLIKTPYEYAFTKNPIVFRFHLSPFDLAEIQSRLRVMVTIYVETYFGSGIFDPLTTLYEYPDKNGLATLNIASVLDAATKFYTPDPTLTKFHRCKEQSKRYYISYRYLDSANNMSDPLTSDTFIALKGGLATEQWEEARYFATNITASKQALHFLESTTPIRQAERKWLYFMLPFVTDTALHLRVTRYFNTNLDTLYVALTHNMVVKKGEVLCVPIDMVTTKVESTALPSGEELRGYTVEVRDSANNLCMRPYRFDVDYRPYYDVRYLYYRNSLGGLDTQVFLGEKEMHASGEFKKAERVKDLAQLGLFKIQDEAPTAYTHHNPVVVANTGWISEFNLNKLRDLLMQKEVRLPFGAKKMIPVSINTSKVALYKNNDKLFNLSIEYTPSYDDVNYSPDDLVSQATGTCPAVVLLRASQTKGMYITIQWVLAPDYDKMELEIIKGGVTTSTYTLIGNSGTTHLPIFTAPTPYSGTTVQYRGRTICNDEVAPFSYSAWTSPQLIDIYSILEPIAVDDVADIGERKTYGRVLQLNAANMNVLANDKATNGLGLTFGGFFDSAGTPSSNSQNGATLALTPLSGGGFAVHYTPTGASIAINAEDVIYYKCSEIIPAFGFMDSNLAKIKVPLKGQVPTVYCKLTYTNNEEIEHKYGLLNLYKEYESKADVYVEFFQNPQRTIPIDVTNFGFTLGFRISYFVQQFNSTGGVVASGSSPDTFHTQALTGTSTALYLPFTYAEWNTSTQETTDKQIHFDAATSIGSLVGW